MQCPVCHQQLKPFTAGSLTVDICSEGCSGIWLNQSEFGKCDQHTDPFPEELLRIRKVPNVLIDRNALRPCPECLAPEMARIALNPDTRFEIDNCTQCGGIWLDIGELEVIRAGDREITARQARLAEYEQEMKNRVHDAKLRFGISALMRKLM